MKMKDKEERVDFSKVDNISEKYDAIDIHENKEINDPEKSTDDDFYRNLWDDEKFNHKSDSIRYTEEYILKKRKLSIWFLFIVTFGVYFVFSIYISNILFEPMQVIGESMYPTMNYATATSADAATDVVYIDSSTNFKYKDIVVFDSLKNTGKSEYYIKRVIATEGDVLKFVRSSDVFQQSSRIYTASYFVYKNGKLLKEEYISSTMVMNVGHPEITDVNASDFYKLVISETELTVPKNCVFVMGDNRNNSMDSRDFGFVSVSSIIGKVRIHIEYGQPLIFAIVHSIKENYLF